MPTQNTQPFNKKTLPIPVSIYKQRILLKDFIVFLMIIGLLLFLENVSHHFFEPITKLHEVLPTLSPSLLPEYAARTTLRMFIALILSLIFTFSYATWAAKSPKAELFLIPVLDILQSVPVLGFISITSIFFLSITKHHVIGAEMISIFAIFTSQAWNMAFSFYQSLKTLPNDLKEVSRNLKLSPWMHFWRIEVPFAMPSLIWNMMMSMSGGWFFVVASEAISVGNVNFMLPGIGSYIATALQQHHIYQLAWAIIAMFVVILLYDQIFFRPLVAWATRFRFDDSQNVPAPSSWFLKLVSRTNIAYYLIKKPTRWLANLNITHAITTKKQHNIQLKTHKPIMLSKHFNTFILVTCALILLVMLAPVANLLIHTTTKKEVLHVIDLGSITMIRVFVLTLITSLIWVPIGIWVGIRPSVTAIIQPIAQFMASFPANLLFPFAVMYINAYDLNPDIWLSPLIVLGTQWYILFNVIAGASSIPHTMQDVARNLHVKGLLWWRKVAIPAIFPFYITGAITASGGAWNASIVAEFVTWGKHQIIAHGLGAYIQDQTLKGNFDKIALGIVTMCCFVLILNHLFWRPLYRYAEKKFRLE